MITVHAESLTKYQFVDHKSNSRLAKVIFNYLSKLASEPATEIDDVSSTFGHVWQYRFKIRGVKVNYLDVMNTETSMVFIDMHMQGVIDINKLVTEIENNVGEVIFS